MCGHDTTASAENKIGSLAIATVDKNSQSTVDNFSTVNSKNEPTVDSGIFNQQSADKIVPTVDPMGSIVDANTQEDYDYNGQVEEIRTVNSQVATVNSNIQPIVNSQLSTIDSNIPPSVISPPAVISQPL
uniref:Uncharacterized protein n=1 Tax=Ditylenchus dipsaci TaxID=166011 RepID=A0A915DKG0_9BILA